jgi:hypothetical protein
MRNYVIRRFRFLVIHRVERSLKLVLRVFGVAENRRVKELTLVEGNISGDKNASVVFFEPDFVRSSAVECSSRETISDFDSGVNYFGPKRSR